MSHTVIRTLATLMFGLVLAACTVGGGDSSHPSPDPSSSTGTPSEAEARSVLAQYVAQAAKTSDGRSYCSISFLGDACENEFVRAGGQVAVPSDPPRVAGSRAGGSGILVLIICGTTGHGESYQTDFAVERENEHNKLRALIPVYWSSTTWSGDFPDGTPRQVDASPIQTKIC